MLSLSDGCISTCSRAILSRCALPDIKARGRNLSSNVNTYTYTGLKLGCLRILKVRGKLSLCPGCTDSRRVERTNVPLPLNRVQIAARAKRICSTQHKDKIWAWLRPISHDDQLFGPSRSQVTSFWTLWLTPAFQAEPRAALWAMKMTAVASIMLTCLASKDTFSSLIQHLLSWVD